MQIVVYDTNIIIDLYDMDLLEVLEHSGWLIHTTSIVMGELHRPQRSEVQVTLPGLCIHEYNSLEQYLALQTYMDGLEQKGNLSMADGSVLLLAKEINAMLCSNDGKLRTVARREGLLVKGSIGIVLLLLEQGVIDADKALSCIGKLQIFNSRIAPNLFEEATQKINEIKGGKATDSMF